MPRTLCTCLLIPLVAVLSLSAQTRTSPSRLPPNLDVTHRACKYGECKAPPNEDATSPLGPDTQEYPLQRSSIVMKLLDDAKCDECSESEVSAEQCSGYAREGTTKSSEKSKDCRDNPKSCPCK